MIRVYKEGVTVVVQRTTGDDTRRKFIALRHASFSPGATATDPLTVIDEFTGNSWSFPFGELRTQTDGDFATKDLAETYLAGFLGGFNVAGGSAPTTRVFTGADKAAAEAARDAYYVANPGERTTGTVIILNYGNNSERQYWTGSAWQDISGSLTPEEQALINSLGNITNGNIPVKTSNGYVNSAMSETSTQIISTKSIVTPDSSITLGAQRISNAGFGVQLSNLAENTAFYPTGVELETSGTTNPFYWRLGPEVVTPSVADKSETFTGNSIQFITPSTSNGIATIYMFDSTVAVADVNLVIRLNSHTDTMPVFDYKRATGGTGFNMVVGDNALTLPVPLFFKQGQVLYVTVESSNSLGLKGQTISGQTVPYIQVTGRVAERVNLRTRRNVNLGGFEINIPTRVDLNTDLSGSKTIHYRVYNSADVTSLTLFIDQGLGFSTVPITPLPTTDGLHSVNVTLPSIVTSGVGTVNFYLVANGTGNISNSYLVQVDTIEGTEVSIDSSGSADVNASNAQGFVDDLQKAFTEIAATQRQQRSNFSGQFVPFTDSVTITAGNFDTYTNETSLYARSDDARVNYLLPTEAVINNRYPARYTILNQGGTRRITTGIAPSNTVVIDSQGSDEIRRGTETGTLVTFVEAAQNDLVTITKSAVGKPWVFNKVTLSTAALLLPSGLFRMQAGVLLNLSQSIIAGIPVGTVPNQGDAFQVGVGNETFGGYGVAQGDVLVALQDNPNRQVTPTNSNWLVIRNATNDIITLKEIAFLGETNQITKMNEQRSQTGGAEDALVWFSDNILATAPFLNPGTDTDRNSPTTTYIGGRDLRNANGDFQNSTFRLGYFYIGITASYLTSNSVETQFVQFYATHSNEYLTEIPLSEFVKPSFADAQLAYFVYSGTKATDDLTQLQYNPDFTIRIVTKSAGIEYTFDNTVNATSTISNLPESSLDYPTRQKLNVGPELDESRVAALNAINTEIVSTDAIESGDFWLFKFGEPSSSILDYELITNAQGITSPTFESVKITIAVSNNWALTNLLQTGKPNISVTQVTSLLPNITMYTATIPELNPANGVAPSDHKVILNGVKNDVVATSFDPALKVAINNLGTDVKNLISNSGGTIDPVLTRLGHDLTSTTKTLSGWRALRSPIENTLTREYAFGWDEDRRTVTTNYFDDISNVQFTFDLPDVFFYNDSNIGSNTIFPNHRSFVSRDNVRIRNQSPGTNISNVFNKVIAFDYSLQNQLTTTTGIKSMLRLGGAGNEPLIAIDYDNGLHLRVPQEGSGTTHTRTYDVPFQVDNSQWHTRVGVTTNDNAEAIVDDSLTGSITVDIDIHLDNNGNDQGTHRETITISNVAADQNFGTRTFDWEVNGSTHNLVVTITYDHDNNDVSGVTRRVLFLSATINNAAYNYSISAGRRVTETWTQSTTYADIQINAGTGLDRNGFYDPSNFNTEHRYQSQQVFVVLTKWIDSDTSSDPEMAAYVIVDGELKGEASNNFKIRLYRPFSALPTNDVNFGNDVTAVGHIQAYRYSTGTPMNATKAQTLYSGLESWLNAFTDRTEITDVFKLSADLELASGERLILTAPNGNRYALSVSDTGTAVFTQLV